MADGSVDVVTSLNAIGHWQDVGAVLDEIARVLRPDGRLVIAFRTRRDDASEIDPARDAPTAADVLERIATIESSGFEHAARIDDTVASERMVALVFHPPAPADSPYDRRHGGDQRARGAALER